MKISLKISHNWNRAALELELYTLFGKDLQKRILHCLERHGGLIINFVHFELNGSILINLFLSDDIVANLKKKIDFGWSPESAFFWHLPNEYFKFKPLLYVTKRHFFILF